MKGKREFEITLKAAPDTGHGCWCQSYDYEWRAHRYWHKAFCVSMFFHGLIGFPVVVAIIVAVIRGLF